jgi:HD superfamily phosphohydrolase YqeK
MVKKPKIIESLTNESVKKHFDDNFKMADYIMKLARHYQASGKEFTLTSLMHDVQKAVEKQHRDS